MKKKKLVNCSNGGESESAYLTEESHADNTNHTPPRVPGVEQISVIPPALVGALGGDLGGHLLVRKLDDWRVAVALTVELGHDLEGLLVAVVGDQPESSMLALCLIFGMGSREWM